MSLLRRDLPPPLAKRGQATMRTIEPARIVTGIGHDQFAEHVLIETMQGPCDLTALFEIKDAVELSDDGNGSSEESPFVLWTVRLDPGPGEFVDRGFRNAQESAPRPQWSTSRCPP